MFSKNDQLESVKKIGDTFDQLRYADEDLRNIMKGTDEFLEKFMPFKFLKIMGKYMVEIFGDEIEHAVLMSERDKVKALYNSLLDDQNP